MEIRELSDAQQQVVFGIKEGVVDVVEDADTVSVEENGERLRVVHQTADGAVVLTYRLQTSMSSIDDGGSREFNFTTKE